MQEVPWRRIAGLRELGLDRPDCRGSSACRLARRRRERGPRPAPDRTRFIGLLPRGIRARLALCSTSSSRKHPRLAAVRLIGSDMSYGRISRSSTGVPPLSPTRSCAERDPPTFLVEQPTKFDLILSRRRKPTSVTPAAGRQRPDLRRYRLHFAPECHFSRQEFSARLAIRRSFVREDHAHGHLIARSVFRHTRTKASFLGELCRLARSGCSARSAERENSCCAPEFPATRRKIPCSAGPHC